MLGAHSIQPDRPYSARVVAELFNVSVGTVRRWATSDTLRPCPRPSPASPLRFMGVDILVRLGLSGCPAPSESVSERAARAARARERLRELAHA